MLVKLTWRIYELEIMRVLLTLAFFSSFISASDFDFNSFDTSLDYAQVKHVKAIQSGDGSWCFHVKVHHHDQGWEHYADGWQVTDLKGNELGTRVLGHPHDNEQPFTRNLCKVSIAENISKVVVRAKCNKHGFGGKPVVIDLSQEKGSDFSVKSK